MSAITHLFEACATKYANNPLLWEKGNDGFQSLTYAQTREKVYLFAAGLMALGINKGDRVALLSEGCNNWLIGELGILYAGAINVPLSVRLTESGDIKFRLTHSGARMIVASPHQAPKLKLLLDELDTVETAIVFGVVRNEHNKQIALNEVLALGKQFLATSKEAFYKRWRAVTSDDYANICYTSGTTADPKGIILTHRNYTANVAQSLSLMSIPPHYVTLLMLPWDHAFAHTVGTYTVMQCGASIASVQIGKTPLDTLKNVQSNLLEIKPHFLLSVPALAKNFRKNIEASVRAKGHLTVGLFNMALKTAIAYNGLGINKGKGWRVVLKPLVALFDKLIFTKIRKALGGRMQFFVGGGALLDIDLQRFFYAIGIPMYQGYGLTEAAPVISSNSPKHHKLGSSGVVAKNLALKICDDEGRELPIGEKGQIVVKGENVMVGYWENAATTAETIKDNWLITGDMGAMDADGFLHVYGRYKSLLIADDGEKYSPEGIEEALVSHSTCIDQIMLYNNQNQFTVALVVINKDVVKRWLQNNQGRTHDESDRLTALKLIDSELKSFRHINQRGNLFPSRWLPSTIAILPEGFTEDNQLLNSTLKMVRGKICERYADTLDYLYQPDAQVITNALNIKTMQVLGF